MLSKIRALKEKKGFTLVELIVVLVILAILAALLIPALTGYIDKANDTTLSKIAELAEIKKDNINSVTYDAAGKVTKVEYQNNGWKCVYENNAYTCSKA